MGKIYVEIQGGQVTSLAPSWGRPWLHVIDEAPDGRVPVKHNARRTVTSEILVSD